MLTESVKEALKRAVGKDKVSFLREDLLCYSFDATNKKHMPGAVVFAADAEDVSRLMRLANKEGFAVIPRGAGTGFTGGSVPSINGGGGVVLSLERMNSIIEIDKANMTAVVEPGVITGDLQDEAEKNGLFYPPDPTSSNFSTIGGNIAECAGGPRCVKYGVTKDYVLGLEAVLPTGEIIRTGVKKTLKGVAGYDLTKLIVGSEGTLAIVTKAYLKLTALPPVRKTMLAKFKRVEDAASAVIAVMSAKVVPSMMELMDSASIRCVAANSGTGLEGVGAALLMEADGSESSVKDDVAAIEREVKAHGAIEFRVAADKNEVKDLWKLRKSISPALNKLKPTKINEDVVVPRSRLVELIKGVETIAEAKKVLVACFGHAGDGNIHVNVMIDGSDADEARRGAEAVKSVFELVLHLDGTITGEHGIGTAKAEFLPMELGIDTIDAMKRIKKALDPNNVLNPGKIFLPDAARAKAV
ncbi:MAG: FAD-binding protein [Deltaproteobacteria bacterium]|nr:FAD-binding protein [Deltaproteobacteria bacterium]